MGYCKKYNHENEFALGNVKKRLLLQKHQGLIVCPTSDNHCAPNAVLVLSSQLLYSSISFFHPGEENAVVTNGA